MAANEAGWGRYSNPVEVDVMYLPGAATINAANGERMLKGNDLVLDCVVNAMGKPVAKNFVWELNGEPIEDATRARLHIVDLSLAHKGNYTCAAVSAAGDGPRGKSRARVFVRASSRD